MRKNFIALCLALALLVSACGALADELPRFAAFADAVAAAGEEPVMGGTSEYMAVIVPDGDGYCRVVTMLDDRAMELDDAISEAEDIEAAFDAFYDYVWTLPVAYVEAFTAVPKTQAELDALVGKTIGELEQAGYVCTSSGTGGEVDLIVFQMTDGLYQYDFVVDADFESYEEKQEQEQLDTLVVRSGRFTGASYTAADLRYHADGTVEPQEDLAESDEWFRKLMEIMSVAQNGEDVDVMGMLDSLAVEFPDAAETIAAFRAQLEQGEE